MKKGRTRKGVETSPGNASFWQAIMSGTDRQFNPNSEEARVAILLQFMTEMGEMAARAKDLGLPEVERHLKEAIRHIPKNTSETEK